MPSVNPRDMKILYSLHVGKANLITKFHLSRIDKEGNVMEFVHAKIGKNFSKLKFLQEAKSQYFDNQ